MGGGLKYGSPCQDHPAWGQYKDIHFFKRLQQSHVESCAACKVVNRGDRDFTTVTEDASFRFMLSAVFRLR